MTSFLSEDFMLSTKAAKALYHEFAEHMPIFDFHSHLPVAEICFDRRFQNLTRIWLEGDHYKWRAMRACGVDENLITGNATDEEKFQAWAATVPKTLGNPLFLWTHLELKRYFGISDRVLCPGNAKEIYDHCSHMLRTEPFAARNLLKRMNVKVLFTTDDPAAELSSHLSLQEEPDFAVKVLPCFRPDRAMAVEAPETFLPWLEKLQERSRVDIRDYDSLVMALRKRHEAFHLAGCRASDHGLERLCYEPFDQEDANRALNKAMTGQRPMQREVRAYRTALLLDLARMNWERGWVQQFHLGALRNVNFKAWSSLGPDTGYDAMGDEPLARGLAGFLDALEQEGRLAKTILYVINPKDHDSVASLLGCFQGVGIPGKIQLGPAWWFNDQSFGMQSQLRALSSIGLLSLFVGMVTDSRSFLSFPRHEYFRRLLCRFLGQQVQRGELPPELDLLGNMVQDICWRNGLGYFGIQVQ